VKRERHAASARTAITVIADARAAARAVQRRRILQTLAGASHQPLARRLARRVRTSVRSRTRLTGSSTGRRYGAAAGVTTTRAPLEFPMTEPSYIISALAAGWMKLPAVVARVRKWKS
jgi:hypothetical protein